MLDNTSIEGDGASTAGVGVCWGKDAAASAAATERAASCTGTIAGNSELAAEATTTGAALLAAPLFTGGSSLLERTPGAAATLDEATEATCTGC